MSGTDATPRNVKHRDSSLKNEMRKRYKERLRIARQTLLEHRRHGHDSYGSDQLMSRSDTIMDEVSKLQNDIQAQHHSWIDVNASLDTDYLLSVMDEISEELRHEEMMLMAERESYANDQELQAVFCPPADVCCPVCRVHRLLQNKHVIFCPCGLRLNLQLDGSSLQGMSESLRLAVLSHEEACAAEPVFSVKSMFRSEYLMLNCVACKTQQIII
eukprot:CFRG4666T1